MKRRWNLRKIWIMLTMSNSPVAWLASDAFALDCICGADLHHSAKIKFRGYPPTIEQRLAKLEAVVFGRAVLRERE